MHPRVQLIGPILSLTLLVQPHVACCPFTVSMFFVLRGVPGEPAVEAALMLSLCVPAQAASKTPLASTVIQRWFRIWLSSFDKVVQFIARNDARRSSTKFNFTCNRSRG